PPSTDALFKDYYAQFAEAYPNIKVQEEQVPYGDLHTKLQTYVAAGDAPDIMMGKGDFTQAYVFNKIALNLSDFTAQAFVDDLTVTAKTQQVVGGKLYASAWENASSGLYYNVDMLEKAGVTVPTDS